MNIEQAKYLANSARIIGMSQFAAYGYKALVLPSVKWPIVLGSVAVFLVIETVSYTLLSRAE